MISQRNKIILDNFFQVMHLKGEMLLIYDNKYDMKNKFHGHKN